MLPLSASAAEYYVAPGGDDGAAGSQAAPWETLQFAAEHVAPGDTVNVEAGSYAGFQLETAGTPEGRISFVATGEVVIDADGPTGDGIRLQNVGNVTIDGFAIEGVSGRGIAHRGATPDAPSFNIELRNNAISGTGEEGMYLSQVAMSLIEDNEVLGTGEGGAALQGHCIYLANAGSDDTTFRGNHLSGCLIAGIHFNGDASIGGDGVISGITIEGNLIENTGQNGINMDGVQDSRVVNNIIRGNAGNGLRAYAIDASQGPRGLVIVNNTIHVPSDAGWCVRITEEEGDGGSVLFNNILLHDSGDGGGAVALDGTPGFSSDFNVVTGRLSPDRGDTILDLLGWRGLGYGSGSMTASVDETFVDASAGDYGLLGRAAAVDFGQDMFAAESAPTHDHNGNTRPQGDAIDAGALERCPDPNTCEDPGDTGGEGGGTDDTGGAESGDTGGGTSGGETGDSSSADGSAGMSEGTSGGGPSGGGEADESGTDGGPEQAGEAGGCAVVASRNGRGGGVASLLVFLGLAAYRRRSPEA
ncbi:MAG: right-handed parallel beta-helix repeat-containing protein [Nannocystaceae bacterium]|nr:right-handed parallel beta-helix repeat-containing protein [Nannocystaceae bacterium]